MISRFEHIWTLLEVYNNIEWFTLTGLNPFLFANVNVFSTMLRHNPEPNLRKSINAAS